MFVFAPLAFGDVVCWTVQTFVSPAGNPRGLRSGEETRAPEGGWKLAAWEKRGKREQVALPVSPCHMEGETCL